MELTAVLFGIAVPLYGCAFVLYLSNILGGPDLIKRLASASAALGLIVHGSALAILSVKLHRIPFMNLFESLAFLAWVLIAIYLVMERRYKITALGAFAAVVGLCLTAAGTALPRSINAALLPALQSHWSTVHIMGCLISYACFILAFGAALCYVIQERLLKRKRITVLQKHLPSLDVADHLAYKMVSLGFPMLTLGIITGALWAQSAWGRYWGWDPKETWSLITWLVYAAYLHVRIVSHWRGKWANRLLIAGFVSIAATYIGVNFLTHGMHNYNW